jgi:hypothetical protein
MAERAITLWEGQPVPNAAGSATEPKVTAKTPKLKAAANTASQEPQNDTTRAEPADGFTTVSNKRRPKRKDRQKTLPTSGLQKKEKKWSTRKPHGAVIVTNNNEKATYADILKKLEQKALEDG